jgi:hypothetical protein
VDVVFVTAVSNEIKSAIRIQQKEASKFARRINCKHLGRSVGFSRISHNEVETVWQAGVVISGDDDCGPHHYTAREEKVVFICSIGYDDHCSRSRSTVRVSASFEPITCVSSVCEDDFSNAFSTSAEELFLAGNLITGCFPFT